MIDQHHRRHGSIDLAYTAAGNGDILTGKAHLPHKKSVQRFSMRALARK